MGLWFTNCDPRTWNPNKKGFGYTQLFALQVRSLRERFELTQKSLGIEVWAVPETYVLHHSQTLSCNYCVAIERLEWMHFERIEDIPRVFFKLLIHVREVSGDKQIGMSIFRDWITLYFFEDYPLRPPAIRISSDWKELTHVVDYNSAPRLCVFNNAGDWTIQNTACRAVEAVVEWVGKNRAGKRL